MDGQAELERALARLDRPLRLVDVGCRWGFPIAWLDRGPAVELIGFDPDEAECARLRETTGERSHATFVPFALGARRERRRLHVTVEPACSSMYPPIDRIWEEIPQLVCVQPTSVTEVDTVDLDSWRDETTTGAVDAIKLDVQGAELDVLRGARATLRDVRAIHLEVAFQPIYAGQPFFGDVDAFLRDTGFTLWRIDNLVHYGRVGDRPVPPVQGSNYHDSIATPVEVGAGQLFWAHATYVRAAALHESAPEERLRDACAFALLDLPDLAGAFAS